MTSRKRKSYKLDDLGFVGRGRSRHRPRNDPSLYGGPYPFFQTGDITAANFYLRKYSQTYNDSGLAQSKLWPRGTLCITIAANIAETAILQIPACFPDSVVGFVADQQKADARYIKYYVDTIKRRMQGVSRGTTQDNLSLDKLLLFDFVVPSVDEQCRVASILSAYDDLIENNTRRTAILEEMARLIFREWFVEILSANHPRSTRPAATRQDWKRGSILDCPGIRLISENVRPYDGSKIYLATADVDRNGIVGLGVPYTFNERPARAQKDANQSSVWFARMAETYKVLCFGEANRGFADTVLLSSGFVGFEAAEGWLPYLFFAIASEEFHREKDRFCTGATQRALTNEGLGRIPFLIPDRESAMTFGRLAGPILELMLTLQRVNSSLRSTRDLLLPKLISGEIDISHLVKHPAAAIV